LEISPPSLHLLHLALFLAQGPGTEDVAELDAVTVWIRARVRVVAMDVIARAWMDVTSRVWMDVGIAIAAFWMAVIAALLPIVVISVVSVWGFARGATIVKYGGRGGGERLRTIEEGQGEEVGVGVGVEVSVVQTMGRGMDVIHPRVARWVVRGE